jgi:hypothetical protein
VIHFLVRQGYALADVDNMTLRQLDLFARLARQSLKAEADALRAAAARRRR